MRDFAALSAALLLTLGALSGCARQEPAPAPAPPRALTIHAERGQSQTQQDRDKSDCQSIASGQATSSEGWAQTFTSCMTARGYSVQ
jgi:hypothetical protein